MIHLKRLVVGGIVMFTFVMIIVMFVSLANNAPWVIWLALVLALAYTIGGSLLYKPDYGGLG